VVLSLGESDESCEIIVKLFSNRHADESADVSVDFS
jgi:hypothetical protein